MATVAITRNSRMAAMIRAVLIESPFGVYFTM
jgi:hypothetical protein